MVNSLQNGTCSLFLRQPSHATFYTVPINNPLLYFNHFSPFCFTSLLVCKTIYSILTMTSFLYNSAIFHLPTCDSHSYNPHQKPFLLPQPFSRFRLLWRTNERDSCQDLHYFILSLFPGPCFPIPHCSESENLCIAHSGLMKMIAIRMGDLLSPLPSIYYHYFYTLRIHITRSQIPPETTFPTDTIFIPSLAF